MLLKGFTAETLRLGGEKAAIVKFTQLFAG